MTLLRPRTFRARIFRDLLVLVGGFFLVMLVVIGIVATRQVSRVVDDTLARSRRAFAGQERRQQAELRTLGLRLGSNGRFAAAVDAAVQSGDAGDLPGTAEYELKLAAAPHSLLVFTGQDGAPVAALLDARSLRDPRPAVPARLVRRLLERGDTAAFGYHFVSGRLFFVHPVPLFSGAQFTGTLTVGLPVDDAVAQQLGEGIGADVCFVAGSRCVARTAGIAEAPALGQMAGMAGHRSGERVTWGGHAYSLVANPVSIDSATPVWWVLAVPLDDVISPFRRLAVVSFSTGLLALLGALALGAALSNRLTRPVQALSAATVRVRAGDYSARVPVEEDDELGALSEGFNEMTHDLMLKDRYQAALVKTNSPEIAAELVKGTDIAPGGQNREVTILYADIRGFTTLTEGMEPQEVIAIVNGFLERAGAAVSGEGGLVDKYLGDQIMALFGAPMARGEDAVRAARAALRIQAAVAELSAQRAARGEPEFRVGIGINTGTAVAGFVGSPERLNYTVLGESVNVAARLCSVAAADEILISEATRRRLGDAFRLAHGGTRQLKGLSVPVEVFCVESLRDPEPLEDAKPSHVHGASTSTDPVDSTDSADSADSADCADCAASADAPESVGPKEASESTDAKDSRSPVAARSGPAGQSGVRGSVTAALLLLAAVVPRAGAAQELPTLQEKGVRYSSPGGWLQIAPSGRLDVTGYVPADYPSWLIPTTDAFVAPRLSLYADVFLGSHLYAFAEGRADRGEEPAPRPVQARLEQAFARWTPWAGKDFGVQAGKFATPFGAYAQRHGTSADPFIRPPLPYEYRTVICAGIAPGSARGFLTWRDEPDEFRGIGSPVIWGVPYQAGAMAFGSLHGVAARVAVMNSAPSSPPPSWNPDVSATQHPSVVAGLSAQVLPELRLGVSYDRGPYLRAKVEGPVAYGDALGDYDQELWGAEATLASGPVETHAEVFVDRWEVPNMPQDPRDLSYYLESRVKLGARAYAAARYAAIRFNRIPDGSGTAASRIPWDYYDERVELGAGLHTGRNTQLRAEYLWNIGGQPRVGSANLLSVQWSYGF
ncbi:MAG: cyaB [Gemmatimonadetes bacterium]|nr:cyaB [Gemmatimonadota bacterium]